MKTLLFIGMEFHKKTRSADFLLELLEQEFRVTQCLLDVYAESPYSAFSAVAGTYDVLICWQVMPSRQMLDRYFSFRHAAFFPMADDCPSPSKPEKWYPYRDFNIICFSSTLGVSLKAAGFSARSIRFFPAPREVADWGDPQSVFLWARRKVINCRLAEQLLSNVVVRTMHIHKTPDPGESFITPSEDSSIEYRYSSWFSKKEDMQKEMERSAFYISPRKKEGIGMSFLEAMAMGRCVVAHDHATMNEYIEHGKTGFLFDLKNPKALHIEDVRVVQRRAHQFIREGHETWEKEKHHIAGWLVEPVRTSRFRLALKLVLRFFQNPGKTIKVLGVDRQLLAERRKKQTKKFG